MCIYICVIYFYFYVLYSYTTINLYDKSMSSVLNNVPLNIFFSREGSRQWLNLRIILRCRTFIKISFQLSCPIVKKKRMYFCICL